MDRLASQLRQHFDWYVAITRGGLVPACLIRAKGWAEFKA